MNMSILNHDIIIGTEVEKSIDPETGGFVLKFKPTEEFKTFFEDIKKVNEKDFFFDRIIELMTRRPEEKYSFSLMEATREQIDYAIERLRKDGYTAYIYSGDLIVETRSRKNNNNLRFAEPFDIARESINLMRKSGIYDGDACTNGKFVVVVADLFYNSEDDEFYYGYTNSEGCSRIMKYDNFIKTYRKLEKSIHDH